MERHLGFFLLRRPIKSLAILDQFHMSVATDGLELSLRKWFQDNIDAQEGIYLASPQLHRLLISWMSEKGQKGTKQFLTSLYKYVIRMSMRSTPFGGFSGCNTGKIGSKNDFRPEFIDSTLRYTDFDVETLASIKKWLISMELIRKQLLLMPNSSLYSLGENFRYVETNYTNGKSNHFITMLDKDDWLEVVLSSFNDKFLTQSELINKLCYKGLDEELAKNYIDELIENKILEFVIKPNLVGSSYLNRLIDYLKTLKETKEVVRDLTHFKNVLSCQQSTPSVFEQLRLQMEAMGIKGLTNNFIKADTFFSINQNQISSQLTSAIQDQISKLFVLNTPIKNTEMAQFKSRFLRRYEDSEVELSIALDPETGIGYGYNALMGLGYAPIVDDLLATNNVAKEAFVPKNWWDRYLDQKLAEHNGEEIELTDDDLDRISKNRTSTRIGNDEFSFYAMGNLLFNSRGNESDNNFRFNLLACGGPTAINLMGRFTTGDKVLHGLLQRVAHEEEAFNKEVIFAEIVHGPDSKVGNVLTRESFYQYEIPYLGKSVLPESKQISVRDIFVSVKDDEVILRSKKLNKRIIPRSSNAHNVCQGLPLYQFLCHLQFEKSSSSIHWDWGTCIEKKYLPRVRYKNIILTRSSWLLEIERKKTIDLRELKSKLFDLKVPEKFVFAVGDNELLINSKIDISLELLLVEINKTNSVKLFEFLDEGNTLTSTHEIILPLLHRNTSPIKGLPSEKRELPQRVFFLGSEWLYIKIYMGESVCDNILVKVLSPIINNLLEKKVIDKYFFVRFKDTDSHLRIRFHGKSSSSFYTKVLQAIEEGISIHLKNGTINNIQVDGYTRELTRYGLDKIDLCESIFYWDSHLTLKFLNLELDECSDEIRFTFAIRRIATILKYCSFTIEEKVKMMLQLKDQFFKEFDGDHLMRKQLGEKYRKLENTINYEHDGIQFSNDTVGEGLFKELVDEIVDRGQLLGVVSSIIHMSVNRLFSSKQRAYELLLYHCLAKYYNSIHCRGLTPSH